MAYGLGDNTAQAKAQRSLTRLYSTTQRLMGLHNLMVFLSIIAAGGIAYFTYSRDSIGPMSGTIVNIAFLAGLAFTAVHLVLGPVVASRAKKVQEQADPSQFRLDLRRISIRLFGLTALGVIVMIAAVYYMQTA